MVDWHGGIAAEVEQALPGVDGGAFALAWRGGYQPAMKTVMERMAAGEGGFTLLDELHLEHPRTGPAEFGVTHLDGDAQARAQPRLASAAGLARRGCRA